MNRATLTATRDALRNYLEQLNAINVSCRTCQFFAQPRCKRFDALPPANVVQEGCDDWQFDGVPF